MSLVKNLKIEGEVYDIRDDSTLRSLSEEQKAQLLSEGIYNGSEVVDGEIFTEGSGKFVEFDKTLKEAGTWETFASDMSLSQLRGVSNVAEGNGAIVIAYNGKGAVSYDGINWEQYTNSGLPMHDNSLIFDGTQFVAYTSGMVSKSTDGRNWTTETVSNGPGYSNLSYFSYDDGRYVIIVNDKTVWASEDAVVWSQIGTLPSSLQTYPSITRRSDGVYLALDSYKYVSTSTDVVEWTEPVKSNLPDSSAYGSPYGLVSVGNVFTTVLYSSSGRLYWSEDGISWTAATPSSSLSGVSRIVKRGNKVFTTGERITYIYVSEDGKTFTKLNESFPSKYLTALAYGLDKYCVFYASAYTSPTDVQLAIKADAPYYEYSLIGLSYNKEEVDAAIAGVDLTGYLMNSGYDALDRSVVINSPDGTKRISAESGAVNLVEGYKVRIGYDAKCGGGYGTAVGYTADAGNSYGTALGYATATGERCVSIGAGATSNTKTTASGNRAVAVGAEASSSGTQSVSLGYQAKATATQAIQLGQGTNSTANTLSVGLSSSLNVQLLDANGKIPVERLPDDIGGGGSSELSETAYAGEGIRLLTEPVTNYEIQGTDVTISDDYVASGFTGASYIRQAFGNLEFSKGVSIEGAFSVSSVAATQIIQLRNSGNSVVGRITLNANGNILGGIGTASLVSASAFTAGQKVYARLVYDTQTLSLYSKVDGGDWVLERSNTLSPEASAITGVIATGVALGSNATAATIYLPECAISYQGKEIWRAVQGVGKTGIALDILDENGQIPAERLTNVLGDIETLLAAL